jgi:hypothetical protein
MRNFLFKFTGSVFLLLLLTMSDIWNRWSFQTAIRLSWLALKQLLTFVLMRASDVIPTSEKETWILHTYIWGVLSKNADMSRILRKDILRAQV